MTFSFQPTPLLASSTSVTTANWPVPQVGTHAGRVGVLMSRGFVEKQHLGRILKYR